MPVVDVEFLKEIPLFSLLDDEERKMLAINLDEKQYLAGQMIIHQGEQSNAMFVVSKGRVQLFIKDKGGEKVLLGVIEPGDLFGELSLLDNAPRSASAIATENTHCYIVDRNDLQLLVTAHPAAALDMMAILSRRIRESNTLVGERSLRNVNAEFPAATGLGARLSDLLTSIAGDIKFVYFSVAWFAIWIVINVGLLPFIAPFDPFPFGLLTMVVSLEAIFLSLFVLISQNRQAQRDKVRNDIEYEVNLKAEIEIRELMNRVDSLQELMVGHFAALHEKNGKSDAA